MKKNLFFRICLTLMLALCFSNELLAATENLPAGKLKVVNGNVQIVRSGQSMSAKVGDYLNALDEIVTGPNSSAGITMQDDTLMSMGPNSRLALNQYAYDPVTNEGKLDASLIKGALRFISGIIGKTSPRSVAIRTPVSTIGIRGTDFIVEVPDGQ
ncbi:MAG: FecR domain-containing protein [Methylophilaceae bacterium]